jgi:SOS-response transcriptional repressor LexA
MQYLTAKQMEIFVWIERFIKKNHYAPTYREIAAHFKITVKGAADHVEAIENKGYIRRVPKISRGIIIEETDMRGVPREEVEKICDLPGCGKVFKTKRNSQRYCSPYCRHVHSEIRQEELEIVRKEERRQEAERIRRKMEKEKKEEHEKLMAQIEVKKQRSGLLIGTPRMQNV